MASYLTTRFTNCHVMKFPILLSFLLILAQSQAATLVKFSVSSFTELSSKAAPPEEHDLTILLGDSKIETQTREYTRIHDFEKESIFTGESDTDVFTRSPIYQDIGFRVHEFQNRLRLGAALSAANIEDHPMEVPYSEHQLSLSSNDGTELVRKKRNGEVSFSHNKKPLFSYSIKGEKIAPETARRFVLSLRYHFGIHPEALEELQALNKIPDTFTIYRLETEQKSATLSLLELKEVPESRFTSVKQSIPPSGSDILDLSAIVQSKTALEYDAYCEQMLADAVVAAKAENDLESVCLFLGYTLATGKQLPEPFFAYKDRFSSNPTVQRLFASINPQSEDAATKAVASLTELISSVQRGRSVILIFRANIQTSLKEIDSALSNFKEALTAEPMIVGAWKDLGDIYFQGYHPEKAWACWSAGRSLNPEHHLLNSVTEFESQLRVKNPEFFLP